MSFKEFSNHRKGEIYKSNYKNWKEFSLENDGYFPIFQSFKENYLLRRVSGNALKLYLYMGLHSGNKTGESWVTIETMGSYFEKSPRTISNWIKELEELRLIVRKQLKYNESSHTYFLPYSNFTSPIENIHIQKEDEENE